MSRIAYRVVLSLLFTVLIFQPSPAQTVDSSAAYPHTFISVEAVFINAGYVTCEQQITETISVRAGVAGILDIYEVEPAVRIPVMVNLTLGDESVRGVIGIGALLAPNMKRPLLTGTLGLRFQPKDRGIFGTIAWRPTDLDQGHHRENYGAIFQFLSLGLSLGYCF